MLDFIIPFVLIGIAELGDKTQLMVLALSIRFRNKRSVLLGSMSAFFVADGIAILFGDFITGIVSPAIITLFAGIMFTAFGIMTLRAKNDDDAKIKGKGAFFSAFSLIAIAELGDKTQLSAMVLAAKYNPLLVFAGVMGALLVLSVAAIYVGNALKNIDKKVMSKIAGSVFIFFGAVSFAYFVL